MVRENGDTNQWMENDTTQIAIVFQRFLKLACDSSIAVSKSDPATRAIIM